MASPKELAELVPETLPEDFGDWDNEAPPAPLPVTRTRWSAWDAAPPVVKTSKPLDQSVDREAFRSAVEEGLRDSDSAPSAPVIAKPNELTNKAVNGSPSRPPQKPEARQATREVAVAPPVPTVAPVNGKRNAPKPPAKSRREAEEAVFQLFSPKNIKVQIEEKTANKKWMTVAAVGAGSVLLVLVLTFSLLHHGSKAVAKNSAPPVPGVTNTQQNTNTPNGKPSAQGKPEATTDKPPVTDNQPATDAPAVTPPPAPTTTANDQPTAPARIPKQVAESEPAPPSFGVAGADGLGGGSPNAGFFKGHTQAVVKVAAKPVSISSGVATGMLVQMTQPVYPPIAKTARVSGTVVLHATIATNGTIKDLQATGGPVLLRQAAVDAVRTWRYKPYMLNNEPVEVETTINVVFTLGG
jgi:protein TonB